MSQSTKVTRQAIWQDQVLAESDDLVQIEGNYYFPKSSLKKAYFQNSENTSLCPWKGTANYYHIAVDGQENKNAAWYYADPKDAAKVIKGRVAFWKGVRVVAVEE